MMDWTGLKKMVDLNLSDEHIVTSFARVGDYATEQWGFYLKHVGTPIQAMAVLQDKWDHGELSGVDIVMKIARQEKIKRGRQNDGFDN